MLIVGACAILGLSIYLFMLEGESDLFDWGFLITGLYVGFLALSSFRLRKSPGCLWCYLMLLVVVLALMIITVIMYFAMKTSLVDDFAVEYAKKMDVTEESAKKILNANLGNVGFAFLICTAVVGTTFAFGWFYRNSTLNRTDTYQERVSLNEKKSEKARKE